MNLDSFTLYLERLKTIRETLTDPNRIKFIDDILSALDYKDNVINQVHSDRSKLIESNMKLRADAERFKNQRNLAFRIVGKLFVKD